MIIIPARLHSTRLPKKALKSISGKPMVIRAAHACLNASDDAVVVATDSKEIVDVCNQYNVKSIMTPECNTGTDRVYEAARLLNLSDDEIIINVQGDYPFVDGYDLSRLYYTLEQSGSDMATLAKKHSLDTSIFDPNIVKIALNKYHEALYLSRHALQGGDYYFEHVGIYAFTWKSLKKFAALPQGELELAENLEHLRFLENGMTIRVVETTYNYIGVNTLTDLKKAKERAKKEMQ